jgi:UDP-N-acetylglucosamine:LPS N-acetylglucosamine transferase
VARLLLSLLESPQTLATMSASAKALAPRDAAARVAAVLTEAQA